jgi:hypothetical protein
MLTQLELQVQGLDQLFLGFLFLLAIPTIQVC